MSDHTAEYQSRCLETITKEIGICQKAFNSAHEKYDRIRLTAQMDGLRQAYDILVAAGVHDPRERGVIDG